MDEAVQNESQGGTHFLVSEEQYTLAGVHIGTQQKTNAMRKFIYKKRNDGLYVLNMKDTDDRIRIASNFIAHYDPSTILVVGVRQYAYKPAKLFAEKIGAKAIVGRFIPGRLTNPNLKDYFEPRLIVVTDPAADHQAMQEAVNIRIPVIALCDTNNDLRHVDLAIPTNNKGRMALAIVYWLLTREVLMKRGDIHSYSEFSMSYEDYMSPL